MPRQSWSRALSRPIIIFDNGKEFLRLTMLADVRDFLKHVPKGRRQFETWRTVERRLDAAAAGGSLDDLLIALRMVLQLEKVDYQMEEIAGA